MIFISDSDVQMGRPRGKHVTAINEQDNEPTYQGLIIIENGTLTSYTSEINKKLRTVLGKKVGSITAAVRERSLRSSPEVLLGEGRRPDMRERRKLSLGRRVISHSKTTCSTCSIFHDEIISGK